MLEIPPILLPKGRKGAAIIKRHFESLNLDTGGCKAFYSPQEWEARGETYGTNSLLVVCHDGGDMGELMDMDGVFYDDVLLKLEKVGVYIEACTGWYSALYEV
jgi:hypothetical protein